MKKGKRTVVSHMNEASQSIDMDPFSTSLLDQLLQTQSQWKNVQDIVRLTFKAIADLVHLHGGSMKDIKNLLTTRASKTQLTTGLSLKANVSDLSRAVSQLAGAIDSKVSFNDLQGMLRDYVKRDDMNQVLASRQNSIPQQSEISIKKSRKQTQQLQMTILQARMDQFQKQISKKVAGCVTLSQFQGLVNVVQQKVSASQINQALQNKVSKHYLQTCLQKKINKNDIDEYMNKKADVSDFQYLMSTLENKASIATLQKLTQVLQNKADKSDLTLLTSQRIQRIQLQDQLIRQKQRQKQQKNKINFQNYIRQIKHQIDKIKLNFQSDQNLIKNDFLSQIKNTQNTIYLKIRQMGNQLQQTIFQLNKFKNRQQNANLQKGSQGISKQLSYQINLRKKCQEKIYQQIDQVKKRIQQIFISTVKKRQFSQFKNNIDTLIEERISTDQNNLSLNKLKAQFNQKLAYQKQQSMTLMCNIQNTLTEAVNLNSSDIAHINQLLARKQQKFDSNLVQQITKKTRKQVQQCRRTVDTLYSEMQAKLNITQYQSDLIQIKKRFDNINRDLNTKANIKDVCVLADSKPNIDDVNKALRQLNEALQQRISETDLRTILKDQAAINQTLCSQNIVGRWLWQSGQLKPGGLIPWQIQCANTVPDHFFWEKDKTSILVLSSGIYQITACLFCKNGLPNIYVNGQIITNKIQQHVAVKKTTKKKKEKQLTATKIQQYINLPSRSRISINSPIQGIQGFLNIKRL